MVEYSQITTTTYSLTPEGEGIAKDGSQEYRVWSVLKGKGEPTSIPDVQVSRISSASRAKGQGGDAEC